MREIKFRAWDKNLKQMLCEGFWHTFDENGHNHTCDKYYQPDEVGVMQYTGLKDKNGKEIYEGDIVNVVDRLQPSRDAFYSCFVDFKDGSFVIHDNDSGITHYRWIDYECEVIGNIHENPELL